MDKLLCTKRISIHAPREGGDSITRVNLLNLYWISIHAPREGGDDAAEDTIWALNISIHAPREGGDVALRVVGKWKT